MSWTQGIQMREDIPPNWTRLLDSKAPNEEWQMECISWDETEPDIIVAHYYDKETKLFQGTKTFRVLERK